MELAGEIRDEFLTCNICLEGYRQPKQLPCLHTFCQKCLSRYIAQTVGQSGVLSVPCPICRRSCVPPDPDPRKLHQWADQFPDNFFVASLLEAVEARTNEREEEASENSSPTDHATRYFMGEVSICSRHLTQRMTHYCLAFGVGVCSTCLEETPHSSCEDRHHLSTEEARNSATDQLKKYRQEMEQVRQDVVSVKRSFSRRPRLLQMKKEEVEISVSDYFSVLRSRCAKLLLSKEKEMIEALTKLVEDESQKTSDSQRKCDDIMTSMDNTMSLCDKLTHSGPFNAMHVLARVEEQIANISRLATKMDQEAKADDVRFSPPSENFEDHLTRFSVGEIVSDFSTEEMAVRDSRAPEQLPTLSTGDEFEVSDFGTGETAIRDSRAAEQGATEGEDHVSRTDIEATGQGETAVPGSDTDGEETTDSSGNLLNLECRMSELKLSDVSSATGVEQGPGRNVDANSSYPSAPPLDEYSPPPCFDVTSDNDEQPPSLPSAPPISDLSPSPADWYGRSRASPALAEAFQQSLRKDVNCRPLMVFSGNLPNESRRGGICGAAQVGQVNRAAFVDRHNHSVKIVDLHLAQIVGFLHLGNLEPWDVTFLRTRMELAVTCPGTFYLLFIPTNSRHLEISYYLKTSFGYSCVAHLKDDLFSGGICAPFGRPSVHVFNMNGQVLREILAGSFTYPRTIFSDSTGFNLAVSDWTSNVVILVTSEGELVCRYREAPSPKGVATSEETSLVHVLDSKWCRLHLLNVTGHCVSTGKVEGCRDPRMVMVVPTSSSHFPDTELTVVADGNNTLHVMTLARPASQAAAYDYSPVSAV